VNAWAPWWGLDSGASCRAPWRGLPEWAIWRALACPAGRCTGQRKLFLVSHVLVVPAAVPNKLSVELVPVAEPVEMDKVFVVMFAQLFEDTFPPDASPVTNTCPGPPPRHVPTATALPVATKSGQLLASSVVARLFMTP